MKYLYFKMEKGWMKPVWSYTSAGGGFWLEDYPSGINMMNNMSLNRSELKEALSLLTMENWETHSLLPVHVRNVTPMDWGGMVQDLSIIWECAEGTRPTVRDGLEQSIFAFVRAHNALAESGIRPDSGTMQMICTGLPEELWEKILNDLSPRWVRDTLHTRKMAANGEIIRWMV